MRVALIADIHGNLVALDAVLDDLSRERVDRVVCLGDVAAFGPQPAEVVARLRTLGCPVVMGDTDAALLTPELPATHETLRRLQEIDAWTIARVAPAEREYIGAFQPMIPITLEGAVAMLCYHGSPRSFKDRIYATTPDDELAGMFAGAHARLYAGGHTHIQMVRRYGDGIVLNPGSVGLAYDRVPSPGGSDTRNPPWGEYAIVTASGTRLDITLRRTPFDVVALRRAALESGMPYAQWWCDEWDEA